MFLINPYILQASGNPLWNDLLAYYTADNTPNDATGNGHDLTLVNGATYGTGIINQGFSYDGVNDYASYSGNIGLIGDFSVSGWVYRNNNNTSNFLQSASFISLSPSTFGISFSGASLYLYFITSSGSILLQTVTDFGSGAWHFLTVTWNETTKRAKIYRNGSLVSDETVDFSNCTSLDLNNGFLLSRRLSTQYLNGSQDEISIYNRIISLSEHIELYNSGAGLQY